MRPRSLLPLSVSFHFALSLSLAPVLYFALFLWVFRTRRNRSLWLVLLSENRRLSSFAAAETVGEGLSFADLHLELVCSVAMLLSLSFSSLYFYTLFSDVCFFVTLLTSPYIVPPISFFLGTFNIATQIALTRLRPVRSCICFVLALINSLLRFIARKSTLAV